MSKPSRIEVAFHAFMLGFSIFAAATSHGVAQGFQIGMAILWISFLLQDGANFYQARLVAALQDANESQRRQIDALRKGRVSDTRLLEEVNAVLRKITPMMMSYSDLLAKKDKEDQCAE